MLDIGNNDNFKSFKYMAKILGNTVADLLKCHQLFTELIWNEHKTKSETENTTNEYRFFLELNFVRF